MVWCPLLTIICAWTMMENVPKVVFIFWKLCCFDRPLLEKLEIIFEWITFIDILNENLEVHGHFAVDLKRSVYWKRKADFAVCFFCHRYQYLNIETWSNYFQITVQILNKRLRQVTTCIILTFFLEHGKGENTWKNISWYNRLFVRLWKTWQTNLLSHM